ncbi:MAG: hypothetical protein IIW49_05195, partial [Treponema sp.]|nr:hypothetical protein [Treponema sp.]
MANKKTTKKSTKNSKKQNKKSLGFLLAALAVVVVGVVLLYFFKPQQFEVLKNEAISYVTSVLEESENTSTKPTSEKPAST